MSSADTSAPKPAGGLRERAITAAVLAPAGIAGVMLLPQLWFAVLLGALFLVGVWEWTVLAGWRSAVVRVLIVAAHAAWFASAWCATDAARLQTLGCGVAG